MTKSSIGQCRDPPAWIFLLGGSLMVLSEQPIAQWHPWWLQVPHCTGPEVSGYWAHPLRGNGWWKVSSVTFQRRQQVPRVQEYLSQVYQSFLVLTLILFSYHLTACRPTYNCQHLHPFPCVPFPPSPTLPACIIGLEWWGVNAPGSSPQLGT